MNFSHGSHSYHQSVIDNTRKSVELYPGLPVAIALDTKGPEIRTGNMRDNLEININKGHEMIFSVNEQDKDNGDEKKIYIDYTNLPNVIDIGKRIYIDDGILMFEVMGIELDQIHVRALNDGTLASHKGVNLPGTNVDLPALSPKDEQDLLFGVQNKVDMIFASFIRCAQDIKDIRQVLGYEGRHIKIIAKIENHQGSVLNFDEILQETDGVMVARGDMGIEIPLERVFIAQKKIIAKCNLLGKPVICATQMLESMTNNPRPTRAEVSDVANAILDGADCVMLSGETAKGNYPIETVRTMHEVCLLAESVLCYNMLFHQIRSLTPLPTDTTETIACSAVDAAHQRRAGAILVLTTSGETARLVSKYHPSAPIIVVTRHPICARQCHLYRGCFPFIYPRPPPLSSQPFSSSSPQYLSPMENTLWQEDVDNRIMWGMEQAIKYGILDRGTSVVAIQGW
ncbi:pyruvate kinase, partial [Cunninghamella echinulata]